ncbi:MAG: hypothetical protein QF466_11095 [Desulfobacterales bacterium]|nr:hypothetical protein [Desulfobacterales bacterium]MDP6683508.1 hypothetical protein [Desulfobacterales bacterium]MDP6807334.1 hypothetical protein [Desulfobacterales bacterium]
MVIKKIPPQYFWDDKHHMPMPACTSHADRRYGLHHLLTKPLTGLHHPFLMAGWAEMTTFA